MSHPSSSSTRNNTDSDIEFITTGKKAVQKFKDIEVKENLLRGVYGYGMHYPTPVQGRCLIPMLEKSDVLIQAKPQSGKSVAYCIASLARVDQSLRDKCQILIMVPQRESALHIHQLLRELGRHMRISIHCCVGGTSVRQDILKLKKGPQIVVGTVGRIIDMIKRDTLTIDYISMVVLDEMLTFSFKDKLQECIELLPPDIQLCIFQTMIGGEWSHRLNKVLHKPVKILMDKKYLIGRAIEHYLISLSEEEKLQTLIDIITGEHYYKQPIVQMIVFCNTRRKIDWLGSQLQQYNLSMIMIHGDIMQNERETLLKEFQKGSTRILIGGELVAQCISECQANIIINYDIPVGKNGVENYMHRAGRIKKSLQDNYISNNNNDSKKNISNYETTSNKQYPGVVINFSSEQDETTLNNIANFFNFTLHPLKK